MASFTFQWTNTCRHYMREFGYTGVPLFKAAGTQFRRRGARAGDVLYVIGYENGIAYLIGRMVIKLIRDRNAEDGDTWSGCDIVEGTDGTPMRFLRTLSMDELEQLRFTDRDGNEERGLAIEDGQLADPQSIRSLRRITVESAALLDQCLLED